MIIRYNATELTNSRVVSWTTKPHYDESGVNVVWDDHDLIVRFWVTGTSPDNFRKSLQEWREILSQPRKKLLITESVASSYHHVDIETGDYAAQDLQYGPRPQSFRVVQVIGQYACECEWHVQFRWLDCYSEGVATDHGDITLAKTFYCRVEFDDRGFQRRIYTGRLTIRDGRYDSSYGPDRMSALTQSRVRALVPELANGFRREYCHVSLSPDHLTINVETSDKQVPMYWSLKRVSRVLADTYQETFTLPIAGSTSFGPWQKRMEFMVEGYADTTRLQLMQDVVLPMVRSKFNFETTTVPQNPSAVADYLPDSKQSTSDKYADIPLQVTWTQRLTDNVVGVAITAAYFPKVLSATTLTADQYVTDDFKRDWVNDSNMASTRVASQDYVTIGGDGDRFNRLPIMTRLIINAVCTHALPSNSPITTGSNATDDFAPSVGLVAWNNVIEYSSNAGGASADTFLAEEAGVGVGGYLVDEEEVSVVLLNNRETYGSQIGGSSVGDAKQDVITQELPRLIVRQTGRAIRVAAGANPRPPLTFGTLNLQPAHMRRQKVSHDKNPIRMGDRMAYQTCWFYEREFIIKGSANQYLNDAVDVDGTTQLGQLTRKLQDISNGKSRVYNANVTNKQKTLTRWNPEIANNNMPS